MSRRRRKPGVNWTRVIQLAGGFGFLLLLLFGLCRYG